MEATHGIGSGCHSNYSTGLHRIVHRTDDGPPRTSRTADMGLSRDNSMRSRQTRARLSRRLTHGAPNNKRARGAHRTKQGPFIPPENWHEPSEDGSRDYRVVEQPPGDGFCHVVTADEIRDRLSRVPQEFLRSLEVVQLSRMTRKKRTFPCYGMQWGPALYLYPIESSLAEAYNRPPTPAQLVEARMFGARWRQEAPDSWSLTWTWAALKDYYLNNVLIHELGHLIDERNRSYADRERFAEWFAIEHGYRRNRKQMARRAAKKVTRRHHSGR